MEDRRSGVLGRREEDQQMVSRSVAAWRQGCSVAVTVVIMLVGAWAANGVSRTMLMDAIAAQDRIWTAQIALVTQRLDNLESEQKHEKEMIDDMQLEYNVHSKRIQ